MKNPAFTFKKTHFFKFVISLQGEFTRCCVAKLGCSLGKVCKDVCIGKVCKDVCIGKVCKDGGIRFFLFRHSSFLKGPFRLFLFNR